jgi:hypothetical protein
MILVKTIIIMRQADGKSENYDREYKEIPATTYNIGYMTLTGLCDLCGAFSHDRYAKYFLITKFVSQSLNLKNNTCQDD